MKKIAASPKLKNFFASEPPCIALGSAKKCRFGKGPSFSKKANTIFATRKGAKVISDTLRKHLVKSNVKHQGKENVAVSVKNDFAKFFKDVADGTSPKSQKQLKALVDKTKKNLKNPKKFFDGKL